MLIQQDTYTLGTDVMRWTEIIEFHAEGDVDGSRSTEQVNIHQILKMKFEIDDTSCTLLIFDVG